MSRRAEVVPDLLPRIAAAASHVRDLEDARRLGIEHRNALIVQAVDAGVSQRAVSGAAGIARSRVVGILLDDGDASAAELEAVL